MKHIRCLGIYFLTLAMVFSFIGCSGNGSVDIASLTITNCERATLQIGYTLQLETDAPNEIKNELKWEASNASVTVDNSGFVTAKSEGKVAISVSYKNVSDSVLITVIALTKTLL